MVRYANGLEFVSVKAYGFYNATLLSVQQQAEHAGRDRVGKGQIQTRTLATIMARVDLVLIEPCGVHTNTISRYQGHVDELLAMLQDAVRWIKELQLRDHGLGDIAKVALVEDIPQHFNGSPGNGWYSNMPHKDRHLKRYFPACRFNPANASLLMKSRAQVLGLEAYVRAALQRESNTSLAAVLSNKVLTVSSWMAPLGVMAKCGGRHGELWTSDGSCDCTHFCGGTLAFVPWFTALFGALPGL